MNLRFVTLSALTLGACNSKPSSPPPPAPATAPAPAPVPAAPTAGAPLDCSALGGANAVQIEMRMLECTLQRAVAAIGRDDLASVPPAISILHEAKAATEQALQSGAYKPTQGDVAAFVALDEAFHASLVTLVQATRAKDHTATAAAMGTVLGGCQGCHAVFRPTGPAPTAAPPAAPPAAHEH
jgi:hypothetical protein